MSFSQWLRQHRRSLDLTQEELAHRIGCSDVAIRKMEAGMRRPSRQVAELLADLFKVPAEQREVFIGFARGIGTGMEEPPRPLYDALSEPASELPPTSTLPAQLTRLIGREEDATKIGSYLLQDDMRLVTLTGPPGIGKTRLALRVGSDLTGHFADGVFLVLLASISDPNLVALAVAQTLGVRETGSTPITVSLTQYLRNKRALLVLDNFEQVMKATPDVVNILETCPRIKAMVTTREPLHVRGEQVFVVPPLQLPDLAHAHAIEALLRSPAMALFVERAQAIQPDFALTEKNSEAVANICIRLEGLPLAIELAAARVRTLTPQEIQTRLNSRLKLLSGGPRDLPARQQTLRGAIEWSYALLSEGKQKLFARLGVFVGGFALQTAEAVCNSRGDLPFDLLDAINSLLDKNLLKREEVRGESRYSMLEMIREYALEQLERSREEDCIRRVHAEYYLALVEATETGLTGPEQPRLLARLEAEHDNIRASLRWARESGGAGAEGEGGGGDAEDTGTDALEVGLRLAGALWRFWTMRGYFSEGREQLEQLMEMVSVGQSSAGVAGVLASARAKALNGAGHLAREQGDQAAARSLYEESLALRRELGDKLGIAASLHNLGMVARGQGDQAAARALHEESLAIFRELEDRWGIAISLQSLGYVARGQGDYAAARSLYEESLAVFRELGNKGGIADSLLTMGYVAHEQGDYAAARSLYEESLAIFRELGHKRGIAASWAGLGGVATGMGQPQRGARLLGAAAALLEAIGSVLESTDRIPYEQGITSARAQLNEAEWEKAWQAGRTMSIEEAIEYAVEEQLDNQTQT